MTLTVASSSFASGIRINLGTTDSVYVPVTISVISTDNATIVGTGSNQIVTVGGLVHSGGATINDAGVRLGDAAGDAGNQLFVLAGGSVSSENGYGASLVGTGILLNNAGAISGETAISLLNTGSQAATLVNAGHILGDIAVFLNNSASSGAFTVKNSGQIVSSDTVAVAAGIAAGNITFVNTGFIRGNVNLGTGNDVFDNRLGSLVAGYAFGGAGNDSFTPGTGADSFNGAANGFAGDTLNLSPLGGTNVALDFSFANTGNATGDSYSNIENITGSATGNDRLSGDLNINILRGGGGNDTLFGRANVDLLFGDAGNDTLVGGLGADSMNGGAGSDRFHYEDVVEGGDTITAFDASDFIVVKKANFGNLALGTLAAVNFVANASGFATTAAHRFIYETDVDKLWYDSNGSVANGRILLADLSNDFAMTNADILIVA